MLAADELVNAVTANLKPYPMEELRRIRERLQGRNQRLYDFGTGDPRIPITPLFNETLRQALPSVSQYPSVFGLKELAAAQRGYLERRYGIKPSPDLGILPSHGSKEAIFHVALSIVGRAGRRTIVYPDPGYPVYLSSTQFSGGKPYPVPLAAANGYLLEPWNLPQAVQADCAALWVNYPHNPTGAMAPRAYWEKIVAWCRSNNTLLLSDECYGDIYDPALTGADRPASALEYGSEGILAFFSLSKRSGMTGYRSGVMAGDARFIKLHSEARANFGQASPQFVEAAACAAWNDDAHVSERRRQFTERIAAAAPVLAGLGLLPLVPRATFYLWCRVPAQWNGDDVAFCLGLAEKGVITTPSSWLGEQCPGWFRLSLVPEVAETAEAMPLIKNYIEGR